MSATTEPKIVCGGCQKQYKWKPELAGKKVKCKCGTIVAVPTVQPVAATPAEDDLYALAEDPAPRAAAVAPIPPIKPVAASAIPPIARPAPGISPIPTPQQAMAGAAAMRGMPAPIGYRGRPSQREVERGSAWGIEGSPVKDFWLPIGCIVVGLIVKLIDYMALNDIDFVFAMVAVGVSTLVEMVIITIGCVAAIKLLDIALGAPLQALLKIAGVAIAPGAIGGLLGSAFDWGWMVGWGVSYLMYIFLLMAFFDLDGSEVMTLSAIIWVMRWLGGMLVAMILVGWLMSGAPGAGVITGGGGGGGMMTIDGGDKPATAAELDAEMAESLKEDPGQEARQWLKASDKRTIYTVPRAQAMQMIDQLYTAGATNVQATGIVEEFNVSTNLVITLPSDKDARKRVFEIEKKFWETREGEATEDVGQKYLDLWFDD